jgi:hypothetical protein
VGLLAAGYSTASRPLPDAETLRQWVVQMKEAPRGPFKRIAWFCEDGTVLPPKESCRPHGGGIQHGEWTERVVAMREGGYAIANVLAELDGAAFTGSDADLFTLKQILLERFLIAADDGWIFRAAHSYRGALQVEDEEAGARRVLSAMLQDPAWRTDVRFFGLREAVRLLPHGSESRAAAATDVRQLAKVIAEKDPEFTPLRVKIHGLPDASDAEQVRAYARDRGKPELAEQYQRLARGIDDLYQSGQAAEAVKALAADTAGAADLRERARALSSAEDPAARLATASALAALLRQQAARWKGPAPALGMLDASLALEVEIYAAGNSLLSKIRAATRRERLSWLGHLADALYGAGLITERHREGLMRSRKRIESGRRARSSFTSPRPSSTLLASSPSRTSTRRTACEGAPFFSTAPWWIAW